MVDYPEGLTLMFFYDREKNKSFSSIDDSCSVSLFVMACRIASVAVNDGIVCITWSTIICKDNCIVVPA